MTSRGQCPRGGVLVKNLVSVPGPPPFKNPGSAPEYAMQKPTILFHVIMTFNSTNISVN